MPEKKGMLVRVKMDKKLTNDEWRARFSHGYHRFKELPGVFSKCFWVNQDEGVWGSFYVFNSEEDMQAFLKNPIWTEDLEGEFGYKADFTILDVGPILYKEAVTTAKDSWVTDEGSHTTTG